MRRCFVPLCYIVPLLFFVLLSCRGSGTTPGKDGRLQVVTTLFPLYDFAKNVGGEKAQVRLLLPPGIEPHSFDPKPRDILTINEADLFMFTGSFMEPWAVNLIKGIRRNKLVVVDSSNGVTFLDEKPGAEGEERERGHDHAPSGRAAIDPHIWLDLGNAEQMVDNILAGFILRDPQNRNIYEGNAETYKTKLRELDRQFKDGLGACETRLFVHGGHFAFNYLAHRYNLTYESVYGFSPNAEPTPRHLADIIATMRRHNTRYVFYEELIQPRVAETIANETGAKLLPLNGGHNVTKEELSKGVSFIALLEQDLRSLRTGLQCR